MTRAFLRCCRMDATKKYWKICAPAAPESSAGGFGRIHARRGARARRQFFVCHRNHGRTARLELGRPALRARRESPGRQEPPPRRPHPPPPHQTLTLTSTNLQKQILAAIHELLK